MPCKRGRPEEFVRPAAVPDTHLEKPVPRRMELDLIDPDPVAVMGPERGNMSVGFETPRDRLAAADLPETLDAVVSPATPGPLDRVDESTLSSVKAL